MNCMFFEVMYKHIIDFIEESTDISRDVIIECLWNLLEKGYGEIKSGRIIVSTWNLIKGRDVNGSEKKC